MEVLEARPVEDLVQELEAIEAEVARRNLHAFVRKAWHLVEPTQPFVDNWHIKELCSLLEEVSAGRIKRLLINVPPGSMKSLLVGVFWPAWEWASKPGLRFLNASYSAALSIRDNLRLKNIIENAWYQRHYNVQISEDQNAKGRYNTTGGGWRIATSVKGVGTGEHPDRIVVDDPTSADQAKSDVEREAANSWFDGTISSRGVSRGVSIVIVMQRLHQSDLSGHVLAKGDQWTHVCWPMRYDARRPGLRDPRSDPSELLWPHLFDEPKVRQLEIDLGPYGAAGQLQQLPAPQGGGLFKREWFKIIDVMPVAVQRHGRGWDTAGTDGAGDWTVGVKMAVCPGPLFIIEDVRRDRLSPAGVDLLMKQTATLDGRSCRQREEQEPGGSGKSVIAAHARMLSGHAYKGIHISGDKVTRAGPFRAQAESGNVYLLRGSWNEAYLSELEIFPNGDHDDQVDGSSCIFNDLHTGPKAIETREFTLG